MTDTWFSLFVYCAVMSATPGPNNVILATSGANFGYRKTLPYLTGIVSGVFVLTFFVCLGFGVILARHPAIHSILKVAGCIYLVWLAWRLVGTRIAFADTDEEPLSFRDGVAFQLVNPKSWMKAATLATVFMPRELATIVGALAVSVVGLIVAFPLISLWALFGVAVGRYLSSPRRLRVFNVTMAVSLLAVAATLLH